MVGRDPGTLNEGYVCRQDICIGVNKARLLDMPEQSWDTIEACSAECGADGHTDGRNYFCEGRSGGAGAGGGGGDRA